MTALTGLPVLDALSPAASLLLFLTLCVCWILGLIYACVYVRPSARAPRAPRPSDSRREIL